MSLFSVFDPQLTGTSFSINWLVLLFWPLFYLPNYWQRVNTSKICLSVFLKKISTEIERRFSPVLIRHNISIFLSLFFSIIVINYYGLMPYVFPGSGHLPFAVSLALPLWLGHMVYSWAVQPIYILAHLVPTGSPIGLLPFIVIIEVLRSLIRPIRLSVRLVANIVAGHLLMTLLSSSVGADTGLVVLAVVLFGLVLLRLLETAVALIQAYVFRVLSTIYVSEVNTPAVSLELKSQDKK